ncbi:MAG: 30S ribosomal protein S19 [Candidatus Micrarchaeia archaeon]
MPRAFSFRGKTLEELKKMSLNDFAKILKSRQRRALTRLGINEKKLIMKVERLEKSHSNKVIKTHTRSAIILPSWVGKKFAIFDGKDFKELYITQEMLGHRLGEFVFTTKRVMHSAPGIRATRGSKFLAVK